MTIRSLTTTALLGLLMTLGSTTAQAAAGPSLADAKKALAAANAAAIKMGVGLGCVVVDSRADMVAAERMDKARFFTVEIARGKARTAAIFGQPSGAMAGLASSRLDTVIGGSMLMLQGAVPLPKIGGAIGCSGGSGQQDEDAAKAGIAALAGA